MILRPLALLAVLALGSSRRDQELERWVRALDTAREPEWSRALDSLSALGEPAAARVLDGFEQAGYAARRARARLLSEIPQAAHCARLLELVDDPDPEVRRLLADALGDPALAETGASERVTALERLLSEDPDPRVRGQALGGLIECTLDEAVPALDRALERLPPAEAEAAATGLAQLPVGRERLIARVVAAFAGEARLPDPVLAALMRGYGRGLAEVPGGGEALRERLPFVRALLHPAAEVQSAARLALVQFLTRAAELSESERAERVLARLGAEGWPRVGCLSRRLELVWRQRGDPAAGLALARDMRRAALALEPGESEVWEARARLYEGAALYALGQAAEALALFEALAGRLEASGVRRVDLYPGLRAEDHTAGGGVVQMDGQLLGALAHVWIALIALEREPGGTRALEELRTAHRLLLEARVVALRTGANDPAGLDALFEHDLSPQSLVLFNQRLAPERRGHALDQALALAEACGRVAPLEMPGFGRDEAPSRVLGDVFFDPERRELLRGLRDEQLHGIERRLKDLEQSTLGPRDPDERLNERVLLRQYGYYLHNSARKEEEALRAAKDGAQSALSSSELRTIHAQLLEYLTPSMHAHALAGELRSEGRTAEARALCERVLAVLSTAPVGSAVWSELSSARFELLRGSTLMDEDRAREAEQAYQDAERRLAAIETLVEQRRADDPASGAQYDGQLRAIRELRGDALLSLAVNANVRMHDPARALGHFERAFELNQSPFMRVLRACYRARSGKGEEARTVLRSVVPVPSLYYNIACTHALLGEKEPALDYLERDLRENHPTEGSRAQKLEWMRGDPDLAGLRGEPRFERLLGERR